MTLYQVEFIADSYHDKGGNYFDMLIEGPPVRYDLANRTTPKYEDGIPKVLIERVQHFARINLITGTWKIRIGHHQPVTVTADGKSDHAHTFYLYEGTITLKKEA